MCKADIGTFSDYLNEEWLEPLGLSITHLKKRQASQLKQSKENNN